MQNFWEWLTLGENYFTYDPAEYDKLFNEELETLIRRMTDPQIRKKLEAMREFRWTAYIAAALRSAGFSEYRDNRERVSDIISKLLVGTLFRGYDPSRHGPFDLRFKRSVGNAVRNQAELHKNRQKRLPAVPLQQAFEPGGVRYADIPAWRSDDPHDDRLIHQFQALVLRQLGTLGSAILDARLNGGETKALVGFPDLGNPSAYHVKVAVQQIKQLARDFAIQSGESDFANMIDAAMRREAATIDKRRAAMGGRMQAVG